MSLVSEKRINREDKIGAAAAVTSMCQTGLRSREVSAQLQRRPPNGRRTAWYNHIAVAFVQAEQIADVSCGVAVSLQAFVRCEESGK